MKLCIFDMGGVVANNTSVVPYISRELGITDKEFLNLAGMETFVLLQTGELSAKDFWEKFSKNYGKEIKDDLWAKFFKPTINNETVEIINNLKKKIRVVLGTNTIDSHYNVHMKRKDYSIFQKVYASNLIGYAKPDVDFYYYILKEEGVNPEDSIFIDDTVKNVEAANSIGINGIIFTEALALKETLSREFKL